jgi:hypothetical protein
MEQEGSFPCSEDPNLVPMPSGIGVHTYHLVFTIHCNIIMGAGLAQAV